MSEQQVAIRELVKGLVAGKTIAEITEKLGILRWTALRHLENPDFVDRIAREHLAMAVETRSKVALIAQKAVAALESIITDPQATPSARVTAARTAMDFSMKLGDSVETGKRISSIEKTINDLQAHLAPNRKS